MLTGELNSQSIRRWSAWGYSLLGHFVAVTALILLPAGESSAPPLPVPVHRTILMPLVYWSPERPVTAPPVRISHTPALEPPRRTPKQFRAALREPVPVVALKAPEAEPQVQAALAPVRLENVSLPHAAAPPVPKAPVKTDVFGTTGNSPNGPTPSSRLDVHTGGFGGTDEARGQASGAGRGNGAGVRTGAFGDSAGSGGPVSGSGSGRAGPVADAGFGNAAAQGPAPRRTQAAQVAETPVEVIWKPKPAYTEEARAKKLEGNVTLEVVFRATGQVQVIRVTRGLGFGLDESARTAAEQIRFHPGKKDGVPVDRTGLVEITFEIS
jgi:TonB family protein